MDTFTILISVMICMLFAMANGADVGEICQVARSGAQGVCTVINNCQPAIDEIVSHGLYPAQCGFRGHDQIVCCPVPVTTTTTTTIRPTRVSQRKCREYEDAKYEIYWSGGLNDKPVMQRVPRCTMSNIPFIVGGETANPNEFPHMVLIGYERTFQPGITWACGGSLISSEFVLTAAHCVETTRYEGTPKYILLGEHDLSKQNERPLQVEIAQKFPHPQFKRTAKYYDIALLKMKSRITFTPYIRPACLPERRVYPNEHAVATGWGRTVNRGTTSQVLMKVILELFNERECNATYEDAARTNQLRFGIIPAQQFCAGSHTDKKDTCQGDSGGPIQIAHPYINCMYSVIGITSFGKECGERNAPGIYTRVYNFLDWIENIVWPNQ